MFKFYWTEVIVPSVLATISIFTLARYGTVYFFCFVSEAISESQHLDVILQPGCKVSFRSFHPENHNKNAVFTWQKKKKI